MCIQPTKALPGAHARKNVPRWVGIWQLSPLRMRLISYWNDGAGDSSLYGQNYKVVYICEWDTNPDPPITTINAELKKISDGDLSDSIYELLQVKLLKTINQNSSNFISKFIPYTYKVRACRSAILNAVCLSNNLIALADSGVGNTA